MISKVTWRVAWESDLTNGDHAELSDFFKSVYGATGAFNALPFAGGRSWAGARPELRGIAYDESGVAAHMGVLRRFIKVGGEQIAVAELGLYGVRRDLEGLGIGHSTLAMLPVLKALGVPFAFGCFRNELRIHFQRFCRNGKGAIVDNVNIKSTQPDIYPDLPPTKIEKKAAVILPLTETLDRWPEGVDIERNGPEL
ncbi:NodA family N-acyltransferase [Azorhizobium caulinodans]|nr:NodA family N-acyltransferase [Azorhizobium caulinodans]CAC82897.1 NodA protein [Azorhizobium sp. SD02]CAC82899.1 NodA protein [Azorhizobium sp. SG05]